MALRYKQSQRTELRAEASARVMRWMHALLGDDETTAVSISGSECGHAACGGNETIILLMRAGEPTIRVKIAKSLETVTQAEIAEALTTQVAAKAMS